MKTHLPKVGSESGMVTYTVVKASVRWVLLGVLLLGCSGGGSTTTATTTSGHPSGGDSPIVRSYAPDTSIFTNPGRGFYRYTSLHELDAQIGALREAEGISLIWGRIHMAEFRDETVLPKAFLADVARGLQIARDQGMKVIVRGSYGSRGSGGDYTTYTDPPEDIVRRHIKQLAPIFAAYADVIALFEAGFIGPWGEWHTTDLANDPDRSRSFLHFLLEQTPSQRMVVVRYPLFKQQVFATPEGGFQQVTAANAYSEAAVARVGHHNDCFLSSATDVGTYDRGGMDRAGEEAYLAEETLHTVFGGESCGDYELNDCDSAIGELEKVHATYLNSGWHPEVLKKWEQQGCMDEVKRRLGARFVLHESHLANHARAGEAMRLLLVLQNVGFASLYNAHDLDVVLTHETGRAWRVPTHVDMRRWKPGAPFAVDLEFHLPDGMDPGVYQAALHLADPAPVLRDDPRFAIRVASEGVWDATTGMNRLAGAIIIKERASWLSRLLHRRR